MSALPATFAEDVIDQPARAQIEVFLDEHRAALARLPGRADRGAGAPVAGAVPDHAARPGEARDLRREGLVRRSRHLPVARRDRHPRDAGRVVRPRRRGHHRHRPAGAPRDVRGVPPRDGLSGDGRPASSATGAARSRCAGSTSTCCASSPSTAGTPTSCASWLSSHGRVSPAVWSPGRSAGQPRARCACRNARTRGYWAPCSSSFRSQGRSRSGRAMTSPCPDSAPGRRRCPGHGFDAAVAAVPQVNVARVASGGHTAAALSGFRQPRLPHPPHCRRCARPPAALWTPGSASRPDFANFGPPC